MQDQPTQLQRLARLCSKFINYTFLGANNKGADQAARMCRLVSHTVTSGFLSYDNVHQDHPIMKLIKQVSL